MRKAILITLIAVILIYGWECRPGFGNGKTKEEISIDEERQQAILKRVLSPDIYGRDDPFAPITASAIKPSVKKKTELEGIIWDESQPLAIINGLIVNEGQSFNGKKVLSIKKDKVILEEGGKKITLEL